MKLAANKTGTTIALFLVVTIASTIMIGVSTVSAASFNIFAFLSVVPNPVGVGQTVTIVMWLDRPTPTAAGALGDHWQNYMVTITKPDGNTQTLGPYQGDATAMAAVRYTPETVGQYYLQFSFPGQWVNTTTYQNWYKPSTSQKMNLTVQEKPISWWSQTPLPTEYWTRPIEAENTAWSSISGNWLGWYGYNSLNTNPINMFAQYTTVPNTAHIVWTKETGMGGLIGGEYNGSKYPTGMYVSSFRPPVIINGRLYYNDWPSAPGSTGFLPYPTPGFSCYDLRTGELLWQNNDVVNGAGQQITTGQVFNVQTPTMTGGYAYLWQTGSTYKMYDAYTGAHWLDFANATAPSVIMFDEHGSMLVYILSGAKNWLAMWNSTLALSFSAPGSYGSTTWDPVYGSVYPWSRGIQWNVTVPDVPGTQSICYAASDVLVATNQAMAAASSDGIATYVAYSLKPGQGGQQLWVQSMTIEPGTTGAQTGGGMAEGVFIRFEPQTERWYAYDAYTGQKLWGPTESYGTSWGMYGGAAIGAYGTFYAMSFDGRVRAYDIKTGTLLWTYYSGDTGYETPYGMWPFYNTPSAFLVADGKVVAPTSEHTINAPTWNGWRLHVINATTGECVWNILGFMQNPAAADGYLLTINGYDNRVYCFGKGQTATTVSAPLTAVTQGQSVMITGTVTDQSPGAKDTPAIADAGMTPWMEYLYMQKTMPKNATGVPVTIDVIDANGNYRNIGITTSDASGLFALSWVPDIEGDYKIIASFAGSESYWPSSAEASFVVDPAAPPTQSPEYPQPVDNTMTVVGIGVALLAAIAIVGAVIVLMLRKK